MFQLYGSEMQAILEDLHSDSGHSLLMFSRRSAECCYE